MKIRRKTILITLLVTLFYFSSFSYQFVKNANVDLNSDGKIDAVSITISEDGSSYTLKINDEKINGKFEDGECDGFMVIDIDQSYKYKEIAVHTPGSSDDDLYAIYGYNEKEIYKMGELFRWPTFAQNGIVYVDDWMGFWEKTEKYVLNKETRKLQKITQEFYYVGLEAITKESFPIYKKREFKEVVANLKPKSKILIVLCQPSQSDYQKNLYLIKSETNLLGWCNEKTLVNKVEGLPLAD